MFSTIEATVWFTVTSLQERVTSNFLVTPIVLQTLSSGVTYNFNVTQKVPFSVLKMFKSSSVAHLYVSYWGPCYFYYNPRSISTTKSLQNNSYVLDSFANDWYFYANLSDSSSASQNCSIKVNNIGKFV